jgi:hypothetical protein
VVYGGKFCYVNADEPTRTMQQIIAEQGSGVARIQATHCMDMIASEAEREKIAAEVAGGEKVWWMTPGWIKFRHKVFQGVGQGAGQRKLPRHTGGAVVLDGIGLSGHLHGRAPGRLSGIFRLDGHSHHSLPGHAWIGLRCCSRSRRRNCTPLTCSGTVEKGKRLRARHDRLWGHRGRHDRHFRRRGLCSGPCWGLSRNRGPISFL